MDVPIFDESYELDKHYIWRYSLVPWGAIDNTEVDAGVKAFGTQGIKLFAAIDDEQIIMGPVMIPGLLIQRDGSQNKKGYDLLVQPDGTEIKMYGKYYIRYGAKAIKTAMYDFQRLGKQLDTTALHDDGVHLDGVAGENWTIDDPKVDKSTLRGWSLPKGTWMSSFYVPNKELYGKLKGLIAKGVLTGFSVEINSSSTPAGTAPWKEPVKKHKQVFATYKPVRKTVVATYTKTK